MAHNATFSYSNELAKQIFFGPSSNGLFQLMVGSGSYNPPIDEYKEDLVVFAMRNALGNLGGWIERFAKSLSDVVRSLDTNDAINNADKYAGIANQNVPFVAVRWKWIAFPAALVLASLVFLLAVILDTYRRQSQTWHGSPLALLFADVDETTKSLAQGSESARELVKHVGGQKVELKESKEATVFSGVGDHGDMLLKSWKDSRAFSDSTRAATLTAPEIPSEVVMRLCEGDDLHGGWL